jgi:hypothetical protein
MVVVQLEASVFTIKSSLTMDLKGEKYKDSS